MNKVYVFFGPPSSGKSYLGRKFAQQRGFIFYEADDDYLPEYRERVKVSTYEKRRVYNEFYSTVISKTKDILRQNKSVVVASAIGKNENRKRFIDEFADAITFVLINSQTEELIKNAIKREFPDLCGLSLSRENEESLREHLSNKIHKFEIPNFPYITIENDYSKNTLLKLTLIP